MIFKKAFTIYFLDRGHFFVVRKWFQKVTLSILRLIGSGYAILALNQATIVYYLQIVNIKAIFNKTSIVILKSERSFEERCFPTQHPLWCKWF